MMDYRLYYLDAGGEIGFAEWIQAATDEDAISEAERLKPGAALCEVWRHDRLIAKLNGSGRFERS